MLTRRIKILAGAVMLSLGVCAQAADDVDDDTRRLRHALGSDTLEIIGRITIPSSPRDIGLVVREPGTTMEPVLIWYLPERGRFVYGALIDMEGNNLSEMAARQWMAEHSDSTPGSGDADGILQAIDNGEVAAVGGADEWGRRVLNVFVDPACGYCRRLHDALSERQDMLDEYGIRVRWIPVSIQSSRAAYAARLLQDGKVVFHVPRPADDRALAEQVRRNSSLLKEKARLSTPTLVWRSVDGEANLIHGHPGDEVLDLILSSIAPVPASVAIDPEDLPQVEHAP